MTMKTLIRPAVSLFVVLTLVTGVVYPLVVTGVAKAAFPSQAGGSLVVQNGKPVGSSLIGQNFSDPKFFWGRPSATSPMAYNGQGSGGSNLGHRRDQGTRGRATGRRSGQQGGCASRLGHHVRQRPRS
jgi:K+-transporting ATPase ATPase C chain